MTEALRRAFERAAQLPDTDQDSLAAAILTEIESEGLGESTFSDLQQALGDLAEEAMEEHRRGRTRPLDPRSP